MSIKDSKQKVMSPEDAQEILRLANIIYFKQKAYESTEWMGIPAAKCPMDMWSYQELIFREKTDLLIETGTLHGGSALYFAHLFDIIGKGKVVSIDIENNNNRPQHHRIEYITGSSIDKSVLKKVGGHAADASSVMVILDSDHKADYKIKEISAYKDFVTQNNYLVAEDSCFDYYPSWPEFGPGPATAVRDFLNQNSEFEVDRFPEQHLFTFAPMAFLKKK
jgi:cephalosporin hydroxylase